MFFSCYTLKTIHKTTIFVDSKNNLTQGVSLSENFSKLYSGKSLGGVYLFFFRNGACYYITAINKNGQVDLSERTPTLFETCINRDGSVSIYCDGMYLSAHKNGNFSFVSHNKLWERLYPENTFITTPPQHSCVSKHIIDSKKLFDVGILGYYNNNNWGGSLTTVATYVAVKELGFSCRMLKLKSHDNTKDWIYNTFCEFTKGVVNSPSPPKSFNNYFNNFLLCSDWTLYKKWFLPLNDRLLSWVDQNNSIISVAASFGTETGGYSKEDYPKLSELLNRFNHLSIRETVGVNLCEKIGVDHAVHLPDPIFSQGKDFFIKVAQLHQHKNIPEPYAAIYLLDMNPNAIKSAVSAAKSLNLKPLFIVADKDRKKMSGIENYDYIANEEHRGISSWIFYCNNADYVITNSFHCLCIALILGKNFMVFNRPGLSLRIINLLNRMGLTEKFVKTEEDIKKAVNVQLDFEKIEKNLEKMSQEVRDYLKNSIRKLHVQDSRRIDVLSRAECTGCLACLNVCPKNCIVAARDIDTGFIYPEIDEINCTHCGLCKKACPVLNRQEIPKHQDEVYCGFSKDSVIRYNSTSGGFFSEFALSLLSRGNTVVYGAAFETPNCICHIGIENEKDLPKIRQSKYAQSEIRGTYLNIAKNLKDGKTVMFCGTPCQCAAVYQFLTLKRISMEKLYLVDFICHSVNSPKAYEAYLKDIERQYNDVVSSVWFKNKEDSWTRFSTRIDFKSNNPYYIKNRYEDDFYKGFLKYQLFSRHSCTVCKFKGENRFSDITLADAWGIPMNCDNKHGISTAIIHTQKGKNLFSAVQERLYFEQKEMSQVARGNRHYALPVVPGKHEAYFYKRLSQKIPYSQILQEIESKNFVENVPEKPLNVAPTVKAVEDKKIEIISKKASEFVSVEKGILIRAHESAKIELKPDAELLLNVGAFANLQNCLIDMAEGSRIIVEGKFKIYHSCRIQLHKNAVLTLGNGYMNTNGIIVCMQSITIGDAIIAPNCYIVDSDYHKIIENGKVINPPAPVKFSGHVWLGQNVTVLKGVTIGQGSCIGAKSLVARDIPANSLAVGVPAKVIKSGIEWS